MEIVVASLRPQDVVGFGNKKPFSSVYEQLVADRYRIQAFDPSLQLSQQLVRLREQQQLVYLNVQNNFITTLSKKMQLKVFAPGKEANGKTWADHCSIVSPSSARPWSGLIMPFMLNLIGPFWKSSKANIQKTLTLCNPPFLPSR